MYIKTVSWEDHKTAIPSDYPECNIMINYEKSSGGTALGTTGCFSIILGTSICSLMYF